MEMLVPNSLSVKITLVNLEMYGWNTCSIYNIKSYGINGEMYINKYWRGYPYFIIHTIVWFWCDSALKK